MESREFHLTRYWLGKLYILFGISLIWSVNVIFNFLRFCVKVGLVFCVKVGFSRKRLKWKCVDICGLEFYTDNERHHFVNFQGGFPHKWRGCVILVQVLIERKITGIRFGIRVLQIPHFYQMPNHSKTGSKSISINICNYKGLQKTTGIFPRIKRARRLGLCPDGSSV